jgi:hypothetical protein
VQAAEAVRGSGCHGRWDGPFEAELIGAPTRFAAGGAEANPVARAEQRSPRAVSPQGLRTGASRS